MKEINAVKTANNFLKQLLYQTQVNEKELKRALQSLPIGKQTQRVLSRIGHVKEIGDFYQCSLYSQLCNLLFRA